jgi:hypothetical protein
VRARSNSETADYTAKAPSDSADYRTKVAIPTMAAVDYLGPEYRLLINEFGYIPVYRLRRLSPEVIRRTLSHG